MKKTILKTATFSIIIFSIISCRKESFYQSSNITADVQLDDITEKINRVQASSDFKALKELNESNTSNKSSIALFSEERIDWDNSFHYASDASSDAIGFNVYEEETNVIGGKLIAVMNDNVTKVIYESYSNFDVNSGGQISFYHQSIENTMIINTTVVDGLVLIDDITTPILEADSWWDRTTKCYKTASDACDDDAECKTLCNIVNFALGSCEAAKLTACAISSATTTASN